MLWTSELRVYVLRTENLSFRGVVKGALSDASCAGGKCCVASVGIGGTRSCLLDGDVLDGELAGICLSLQSELDMRKKKRNAEDEIRLYTDSQSAIHWLRKGCDKNFKNRRGRLRASTQEIVATFETLLSFAHPLPVRVEWIPRTLNSEADGVSRTRCSDSKITKCKVEGGFPSCKFSCVGDDNKITCSIHMTH